MAEQKASVLVVANRTAGSDELLAALRERADEGPTRFHLVVPATARGVSRVANPDSGVEAAENDLDGALDRLRAAGLEVDGQIGDPDPFTAIQNALQFYVVDEIVISTFPGERSGWLRMNLIERTRSATGKPVEHIEVSTEQANEEAAA